MVSLRFALVLFVCYFFGLYLYYRWYFRPRVYLLLLSEKSYMDNYVAKLPHMLERPDERQGMVEFMLTKRRRFIRAVRNFYFLSTALYIALLWVAAKA